MVPAALSKDELLFDRLSVRRAFRGSLRDVLQYFIRDYASLVVRIALRRDRTLVHASARLPSPRDDSVEYAGGVTNGRQDYRRNNNCFDHTNYTLDQEIMRTPI